MAKRGIVGTLFLVFIMCFSYTSVLAKTEFPLSNPKVWTSGMKVDTSSTSNATNISLDSTGIQDNISSTYIFNTGLACSDSTSGVKFHITQHSTSNLWLNFILEDTNNNKKTLAVDGAAILYRDGSVEPEVVKVKDLSVNLGLDFSGDVYIPFSYLKLNEKDSKNPDQKFDIKSLASSGLVFAINANSTSQIEIKNSVLLNKDEDENADVNLDANITGEDALQISDVAESNSEYSIVGEQKDEFSFEPIEGVSGVSITKDGILSIDKDATNQVVTIKAFNDKGFYISKNVTIYKSWISTQDNPNIKIPEADQIKSIKNNYEIFSEPAMLWGIRLGFVAIACVFGVSYHLSRRNLKG